MEFINPELQRIYEESKPIIEAHLQRLDSLSKDIRQVEDFLSHSAVGISENYKIDSEACIYFNGSRIIFNNSGTAKHLNQCNVRIRLKTAPHLTSFMKFCLKITGET